MQFALIKAFCWLQSRNSLAEKDLILDRKVVFRGFLSRGTFSINKIFVAKLFTI
jgi:hypothetical protein